MKRKSLALFMAILTLTASLSLPVGAYSDVTQEGVKQVLSVMGIMTGDPDGNMRLDYNLTRAEFAKIVIAASPYAKTVPSSSLTSAYRDVKYTYWAAGYIKAATDAGYMKGYSDGSFRPNQPVLYEEAVTTVLRLLGYTTDDFGTSYPYGQLAYADSLELTNNLSGQAGSSITRRDVMYLIYNALNAKPKTGSYTAYAEALGYSTDENGLDYSSVLKKVSLGPVVVTSSDWYSNLGLNLSNLTIYKNGSTVTVADVDMYDIVYYSKPVNTVWVYNNRVTGIYSDASPDKNSPSSVVIAGNTYSFETSLAAASFGAGGSFSLGDNVTVLLGRDGKIAAAYSTDKIYSTLYGIVTETGIKTYTSDGNAVNSYYAKGVLINGTPFEYTFSSDMSSYKNKIVKLSINGAKVTLTGVGSSSTALGYVRASNGTIGSRKMASNISIIDVNEYGNYVKVYPQRIDGVNLTSGSVYFYNINSSGEIDTVVLNDVTGDTYQYGVVKTYDEETSNYGYDIAGSSGSATLNNVISSTKIGPAAFALTDGKVSGITILNKLTETISLINSGYIQTSSGNKYLLSDNVAVYSVNTGSYTYSSLSAVMNNPSSILSAYYDKAENKGGRIRVIVTK